MGRRKPKAAHFLLIPELAYSPPNEAIVSALIEAGYDVHLFAPGDEFAVDMYGPGVSAYPVEYSRRWLLRNAGRITWRGYDVFSGTSEDPAGVVGVLSWLHNRPSFILADEIKSGSYRGNAPEYWKKLCRWAMRRARFNIVNDSARIPLLRAYAGIESRCDILVYPGCYRHPPRPADRSQLRQQWGIPEDGLLLAASGGFNLSAGAEWLIHALQEEPSLYVAIQPLSIDPLAKLLLYYVEGRERLHVQEQRLGWHEAWASAAAFDIGVAIYSNPAPHFQSMVISSNRLCMFVSMGVPVISSRQPSFEFLEEYDCGVMVNSYDEFIGAVAHISENLQTMKENCAQCFEEYISPEDRYREFRKELSRL